MRLYKESNHFMFYCYKNDVSVLDALSYKLESNFGRITSNLMHIPKNKILVEVYPDIEAFHNAMGELNAPPWFIGYAGYGKISVVSPNNPGPVHTYDSIIMGMAHEIVHIVLGEINGNYPYSVINDEFPKWLDEGIASFEGKNLTNIKELISDDIKENRIPKFEDMKNDNFGNNKEYQFSYTIIEFLVKEYGYDALNRIIRSPNDYIGVFNITKEIFYQKWVNYIECNYA